MPGLEIHPLSELREEAAALLADRFARQRAAEPLLPEVADVGAQITDDGLVATRAGQAVAYLTGEVRDDIAYVGIAGVAASEPEAVRDLFAALAPQWGVTRFMAFAPASEPALVDAFFRLQFGHSATQAVAEPAPLPPVDFGGTIRESVRDDVHAYAELEYMLWQMLAAPPSYSGLTSTLEEHEEESSDLHDGVGRYWPFAAELDGRIVGMTVMYDRPTGDLRVPEQSVDLAFAGTREDVRGSGVGLALTNHVFSWAHERGYRSITTDWRTTNLPASRFWPKRGFRPTYHRLYRAIP